MTIKVTVANSDSRESSVIEVRGKTPAGEDFTGAPVHQLKGGESAEVYVHSGLQLQIKEIGH